MSKHSVHLLVFPKYLLLVDSSSNKKKKTIYWSLLQYLTGLNNTKYHKHLMENSIVHTIQ